MNSAMLTFFMNCKACRTFVLALPILCLAACETAMPSGMRADKANVGATPESVAAPVSVINYDCDGGRIVEVTLNGPERAQLKINGATAPLTAVRSASGAKFQSADGSITFWSKGNEATVDTVTGKGKATHMVCTVRP